MKIEMAKDMGGEEKEKKKENRLKMEMVKVM